MPNVTISVLRPEVAVSTTQTGPTVTITDSPIAITQNTSEIAVTSTPQTVSINTAATTIQTTTLDEAFQGEWDNDAIYHRGDLVRYEQGVYVYIATTPQTTQAPDVATDLWVLLFSESGLTGDQVIALNRAFNLNTWDPLVSYSVGDIVVVTETHDNDGLQNQPFPVLYRLYSSEGSVNIDPRIHHNFPSYSGDTPVYDVDSSWQKLVGVCSVNGFSGDINLDTDNIPEGSTNRYYTELYFNQSFSGKTTSDLTEGTNLYYTDDRVNTFLTDGSVSSINFSNNTNLSWDADDLSLQYTINGVNVQVGQDSVKVKNETGSTVTKGTVVRILGSTGTNMTIGLASNNSEAASASSIGFAAQTINNNATGLVFTNDYLVGVNTSAIAAGTPIWLGTNGQYTATKPLSPAHLVFLGWIVRSHATEGIIYINVQNGWELEELHDVLITDPVNGSILQYDAATDLWKNVPGTTTNIAEGTNLYYTSARANSDFDTRLATKTTSDLTEGTNLYYTQARFDSAFAAKSTTNLSEGTNLYYTTARQNTDFDARLATKTTTNLTEGTNLYYTTARLNTDFDSRLATKTTSNLAEGSNLYFTNARARSALSGSTGISYNSSTGSIAVDTSTIATQSYVSQAISDLVDSAPSTLDTLNELAAALGDDPNFATTITTSLGSKLNTADFTTTANTWYATSNPIQNNDTDDLAEGTTNLYYTELRATNNFDSNLSTATTSDLAEGTNLYFTTGRARNSISGSGDIAYDPNTGVISYTGSTGAVDSVNGQTGVVVLDTDDISEGTTNQYFTTARARNSISGTGDISYDSATGVISYTGTGGIGAVASVNGQTGVVVLDTDDISEGTTNLYHTDARSRTSISVTTEAQTSTPSPILTYNSSTGVLTSRNPDATQVGGLINGVDLAQDLFDKSVYVKSLRNGTRIKGEVQATTDDSYVFPSTPLNGVSDNNGYSAASSISGNAGNGANALYTHFDGDTFSAANSAAALNLQNARGNSVAGVMLPWTGTLSVAPSATQSQDVLGTLNFNGYCTTDFGNRVGTQYQGGGVNTLHGIQFQSYAAENFSNSTLTIPAANITAVSSFRVALTTPTVTGTKGQISFGTTTPAVGQAIRVTGTLTGNATGIVSGQNYWIIATNGTTTATLSATPGGLPIDTTGTTLTGLTLTRCGVTLTISGQSKYPYGRNSILNVSGLNNITNGAYPVGGIPTLTSVVLGIPHAVAPTLSGSQSLSIDTPYMASGFRIRAFPLATPANTSNRITIFDHSVATATYKSDQYTFQGGTNTFNYMSLNAAGGSFNVGTMAIKDLTGANTYASIGVTSATFNKPVVFPSYTTTTRDALTPSAGWVVFNTTTAKLQCYDGTTWQDLF